MNALPIHDALPGLLAALETRNTAVLVAPPGAGKTTGVPLALLEAPWRADGRILVLEPRRLAARAAATRMAQMLGEAVGGVVGYRVRLDARVSAATRVEVVTEGVFTRMILDDPALDGVAAILFDEFHERSVDADLGLALARDAQQVLRPNLRLLIMSATLDGAAVARLLDDAPVIESHGRSFAVETRYLGRDPAERLEPQVARAVSRALAETDGGVLVFLPGAAEIGRVERLLAERLARRPDVVVHPLYGALTPAQQDGAIAPAPAGVRKVVLATAIAQTSLTLDGVGVVIDGGLSRVPRYDPGGGLTRLATMRVSRAAADQRRGRAGRTAPGVCYRLWDEAETRALVPFDRPEILDSDLSGLALALAQWGAPGGEGLAFLDPPPKAALAQAGQLLAELGALDDRGALTDHGRRLAELGAPPRLAHLMVRGAERGAGARAARIAVLLSERGLGGDATDVGERLERFARDASPRARDARALADRWTRQAVAGRRQEERAHGEAPPSDGALLALAYPDRIAKARGGEGVFNLISGRAVRVEPTDALAAASWLAVGELGGGTDADRVRLAGRLDRIEVETAAADRILDETRVEIDDDGRVRARRLRRLGALVLDAQPVQPAPREGVRAALLTRLRDQGLAALPLDEATRGLRARVALLAALDGPAAWWPDLSDATLLDSAGEWVGELLADAGALAAVDPRDLRHALLALIPYDLQRRLEAEAPETLRLPTGAPARIDYAAEGGPRVEARVQALFGLAEHPCVARGRVLLTLALLSPAGRPVQVTRDLPGFWAGSWKAVRAEMRGRYPRHPWPEDPLAADPTTRAKPRGT